MVLSVGAKSVSKGFGRLRPGRPTHSEAISPQNRDLIPRTFGEEGSTWRDEWGFGRPLRATANCATTRVQARVTTTVQARATTTVQARAPTTVQASVIERGAWSN